MGGVSAPNGRFPLCGGRLALRDTGRIGPKKAPVQCRGSPIKHHPARGPGGRWGVLYRQTRPHPPSPNSNWKLGYRRFPLCGGRLWLRDTGRIGPKKAPVQCHGSPMEHHPARGPEGRWGVLYRQTRPHPPSPNSNWKLGYRRFPLYGGRLARRDTGRIGPKKAPVQCRGSSMEHHPARGPGGRWGVLYRHEKLPSLGPHPTSTGNWAIAVFPSTAGVWRCGIPAG